MAERGGFIKKTILTAALLFIVAFAAIPGCSSGEDAAEIASFASAKRAAAPPESSQVVHGLSLGEVQNLLYDLLPRGQAAVELVFGYTLEAEIPQDAPLVDGPDYFPVKEEQQTTIGEMKAKMEEVFTPEIAQEYYQLCFEGETPVYKEENGELFYNRNRGDISFCPDWHVDTAVIMRQTIDEIMVEVDTTSFDSDPVKKNLFIKKSGDSWYLDTQTVWP